jgi:hypothetical protein
VGLLFIQPDPVAFDGADAGLVRMSAVQPGRSRKTD